MNTPAVLGHPTHHLRASTAGVFSSTGGRRRAREVVVECPRTISRVPEAEVMAEAAQRLQIGMQRRTSVFADVGAHCGFWSLIFGSRFTKVVALEPSDYQYALLQRNCERNSAVHINAVQAALSDYCGYANLFVTGLSGGGNTLQRPLDEPMDLQRCKVATLDSLNLAQLDLLKIDVEGHELRVLKGSQKTLRAHKPCIVFEANSEASNPIEFLKRLGYRTEQMKSQSNMFFAQPML